MTSSPAASVLLLTGLLIASALPARGSELPGQRPRVVDPARAKAQDTDRKRLLAKLRDEAPKIQDAPASRNALDLPIFRRYDKP